jgi:hypothetical protein
VVKLHKTEYLDYIELSRSNPAPEIQKELDRWMADCECHNGSYEYFHDEQSEEYPHLAEWLKTILAENGREVELGWDVQIYVWW